MNILITGGCGHIGSYLAENINKIQGINKVIISNKHADDNTETIASLRIPTLFGYHTLHIDKSMYCGLAMDGWLRPYFQEWVWQIPIGDPRIYDRGRSSRSVNSREEFAIWFLKRYLANST